MRQPIVVAIAPGDRVTLPTRSMSTLRDQLAETKERYREASGGVTERTRALADVSDELEKVKQEMDERGTSMTDGSEFSKKINKLILCPSFFTT